MEVEEKKTQQEEPIIVKIIQTGIPLDEKESPTIQTVITSIEEQTKLQSESKKPETKIHRKDATIRQLMDTVKLYNIADKLNNKDFVLEKWMGICGNCGRSDVKPKQCSGCHSQQYCSEDCQKAHRELHKRICSTDLKDLHKAFYVQFHTVVKAFSNVEISKPFYYVSDDRIGFIPLHPGEPIVAPLVMSRGTFVEYSDLKKYLPLCHQKACENKSRKYIVVAVVYKKVIYDSALIHIEKEDDWENDMKEIELEDAKITHTDEEKKAILKKNKEALEKIMGDFKGTLIDIEKGNGTVEENLSKLAEKMKI